MDLLEASDFFLSSAISASEAANLCWALASASIATLTRNSTLRSSREDLRPWTRAHALISELLASLTSLHTTHNGEKVDDMNTVYYPRRLLVWTPSDRSRKMISDLNNNQWLAIKIGIPSKWGYFALSWTFLKNLMNFVGCVEKIYH